MRNVLNKSNGIGALILGLGFAWMQEASREWYEGALVVLLGLAVITLRHAIAKAIPAPPAAAPAAPSSAGAVLLVAALLVPACASGRDAARSVNQDHADLVRATAGDASTDPVNFDPLTLVAASGNLGDMTAEPIDISSRTHNPQAGWNLLAALLSTGTGALDDPMLAELREDVRVLRSVWMQDVDNPERRAALDSALAAMAAYLAEHPPQPLDLSGVVLPTTYTYAPVILNLAGADETAATAAVTTLPAVVENSRVEFVDEE